MPTFRGKQSANKTVFKTYKPIRKRKSKKFVLKKKKSMFPMKTMK